MQDQDVKLGELYTDEVTNFAGICTGLAVFVEAPTELQIENDQSSRWIPITRVTPGFVQSGSGSVKNALAAKQHQGDRQYSGSRS